MKACDPAEQEARQQFLDELYRAAGRDRKDHPYHSSYTGLYQEWSTQNTETEQ